MTSPSLRHNRSPLLLCFLGPAVSTKSLEQVQVGKGYTEATSETALSQRTSRVLWWHSCIGRGGNG